jgi:hypothetical protein
MRGRSRGATRGLLDSLALASSLALAACSREPERPPPRFVERLAGSGVDFVHEWGRSGRKLFPEIMSGGVSLLDHDGDGDLDVWFAQGVLLPGNPAFDKEPAPLDRLYRNDGGFHFVDVTAESGAGEPGYTLSAACPDVDGDGDVDLYVCNLGGNRLLVNDGKGHFTDATAGSGLGLDSWSTCAAFADLDRDGDLDCYVGDYVLFELDDSREWGDVARGPQFRAYPHPDNYPPARDHVFRNDGGRDGAVRFVDVSEQAGLAGSTSKALAVVPGDFDDDGDVDLYVANDRLPNHLWRNDTPSGGALKLVDVAVDVACALDGEGRAKSGMGSDFGDVDNDGDLDLFTADMALENNTLYVNQGGTFSDETTFAGLARDSFLFVGFGARLFDQDLDGDLDLALANGHVLDNVAAYDVHQTFAQPAQLFENEGRGKFHLVKEEAGPYFSELHVGRGLAAGDLDDDGDLDLVLAHWGEPPQLLENTTIRPGGAPPWIGLVLKARGANTQALGARVECTSGDLRQIAEIRGAGSYQSWSDTRLTFGLGPSSPDSPPRILVHWPDGTRQEFLDLAPDRYHALVQP